MNYNVLNYPENDINRFWNKVNVKYLDDGTPDFNACMEWTGRTFHHGSGLKIAKDFNVDHTVIYKIKNNRAWNHVQI